MSLESDRRVIVHYHIFKNAGSSVDRTLDDSFGNRWAKFDRDNPGAKISPLELKDYLERHPDLVAVSSHQAVPPVPTGGIRILPILFFRHPVTRAHSAYRFEWGRQTGLDTPSRSFDEYVRVKFEQARANAIEDFQVRHVANRGLQSRRPAEDLTDEQLLANAKAFVDALDFFGIVERFDESMVRLSLYLRPYFPEFRGRIYRENVTGNPDVPVEQQVASVLDGLSPSTRNALIERNGLDLALHSYVSERFSHMGLKENRTMSHSA